MRISRIVLLVSLFLATLFAQNNPKPTYGPIVRANNRFAIKFLQASFPSSEPRNIVTGPAALSSGLSWVMMGASDPARTEIQQALELQGLYDDEINLQNLSLMKAHLPRRGQYQKTKSPKRMSDSERMNEEWLNAPRLPRGYFRAVGLWTEKYSSFQPRMQQVGAVFYGMEPLTFPANWTAADLDTWMDARLMGATQKLGLPPRNYAVKKGGVIYKDFKLVDASSFNCDWETDFSAAATLPAYFYVSEAKKKTVPMMSRGGHMSYGESSQYQAVRLPYKAEYSLYIVLPSKPMNLSQLIAEFDLDQIAIFEKSLAWRPGTLKLPKFTIADWYDAAKALKKLGVRSVFDSDDGLKPEFSPYGGKLFDIQVRNRMKVDERGTTLINVTEMSGGVIGGVPGGAPRPEVPFEMIVDRPFLFYIVDDVTREVLYLGAVVEP